MTAKYHPFDLFGFLDVTHMPFPTFFFFSFDIILNLHPLKNKQ